MNEIHLVLPYPVSGNIYWRHVGNKVVRSAKASAYKSQVAWIAKAAGVKPLTGRLAVHIALYPQRPLDAAQREEKLGKAWADRVRCLDLDNARKVLYDALNGIAYLDDKWIWKDSAERMEPDGEARVVVTITKLEFSI
jgi:crossover junction endodeoxyribonuclease RusA